MQQQTKKTPQTTTKTATNKQKTATPKQQQNKQANKLATQNKARNEGTWDLQSTNTEVSEVIFLIKYQEVKKKWPGRWEFSLSQYVN